MVQAPAGAAAAATSAAGQKIDETKQIPEKFLILDKQLSPKEIKFEKFEIKEHKLEIKDHKLEKFEIKEHKPEKLEFEVVGPGPVGPGDPIEQRIANLEATMTQLLHFIPENLRPDLSQGALKQEPDAAKQGASDATKPAAAEAAPKEEKGKR